MLRVSAFLTDCVWRSIQGFRLIKYRRLFHQPDAVYISPTSPAEKQINFTDKCFSTFCCSNSRHLSFLKTPKRHKWATKVGKMKNVICCLAPWIYQSLIYRTTTVFNRVFKTAVSGLWYVKNIRSNYSTSSGWLLQCHSNFDSCKLKSS